MTHLRVGDEYLHNPDGSHVERTGERNHDDRLRRHLSAHKRPAAVPPPTIRPAEYVTALVGLHGAREGADEAAREMQTAARRMREAVHGAFEVDVSPREIAETLRVSLSLVRKWQTQWRRRNG